MNPEKKEVILEFARKLGTVIRTCDDMKRMQEAEAAYRDCSELQALITEYYVNEKADSENSDPELGVAIKRRMEELYSEIAAHPVYAEYMEAQTAVRDLMNAVNDEIQFAVSGKRSCSSGGCASCAGCGAAAASDEKQ